MAGTWRSGGRPVPTALKVLRGTQVKGRKDEPRYSGGRPVMPPELAADLLATANWTRLADRLEAAGVLTTAHGEALGMLAEALADYTRVRTELHAMGHKQYLVDETFNRKGQLIRRHERENPLFRRSERLALLINRLLGEFGLTPATQTRIEARQAKLQDPFEAFLGGKRPR